jgi:hypothetical protein
MAGWAAPLLGVGEAGAAASTGGLIESLIGPHLRQAHQGNNKRMPNVLPGADSIIAAWTRGFIPDEMAAPVLACHGIDMNTQFGKVVSLEGRQRLWNGVARLGLERPGGGEALNALVRGRITPAVYDKMVREGAGDKAALEQTKALLYTLPSPGELILLLNREKIGQGDCLRYLNWHGFQLRERELMLELAKEYPSSSDLVRFAVRHGFEPDLIRELGFDDEISADFLRYHAALGFGWEFDIHHPQFGDYLGASWAKMAWWSHWVWPSPTQAVVAGFRFAPTRDRTYEDRDTAALDVDRRKVNLLLRGNDYPPQFRDIIAGLGRPLPGLRQLRLGIKTNNVDRPYIVELFRKQGYTAYDRSWMADALIDDVHATRYKEELREAGLSAQKAYHAGAVTDIGFTDHLARLGFTTAQQQEALSIAQVERRVSRVEEIKGRVKRAVLSGAINGPAAYSALQAAGVRLDFAQDWVDDWVFEATLERRQLSARECIKDACDGLLALPDLIVRLQNLRYNAADIALMLLEAELCIAEKAEKQLERAAKLKEQQKAHERKDQGGGASLGLLKRWLAADRISVDLFRATLQARRWPEPEIELAIEDALAGKSLTPKP